MKRLTFEAKGFTPYSMSKIFEDEKNGGGPLAMPKSKTHDEFDRENVLLKARVNEAGQVVIHPQAFVSSLYVASIGEKLNKKALTRIVEAGISMESAEMPLLLLNNKPVKRSDLLQERLFVPSDGKPLHKGGKGSRVWRSFPYVPAGWSCKVNLLVLDEQLESKDTLQRLLGRAGKFVGIGRFRPERGGFYGRFAVEGLALSEFTS